MWVDAHHILKPSIKKNSIVDYIHSLPENIDIVFKKHTGFMPIFDKTGKIMQENFKENMICMMKSNT